MSDQSPRMSRTTDFFERVDAALRQAVARLVDKHRRTGEPLVVSKDGKVTFVPPEEALRAREEMTPHSASDESKGNSQ